MLAKKLSIEFPLLADEGLDVIRKYNVVNQEHSISKPAVFVVDQNGKIVWKQLGENPSDRALVNAIIEAIKRTRAS